MNLNKIFAWAIAVVLVYTAAGNLHELQNWVWRAQAKFLYESRTSTWGSPRFFSDDRITSRKKETIRQK